MEDGSGENEASYDERISFAQLALGNEPRNMPPDVFEYRHEPVPHGIEGDFALLQGGKHDDALELGHAQHCLDQRLHHAGDEPRRATLSLRQAVNLFANCDAVHYVVDGSGVELLFAVESAE